MVKRNGAQTKYSIQQGVDNEIDTSTVKRPQPRPQRSNGNNERQGTITVRGIGTDRPVPNPNRTVSVVQNQENGTCLCESLDFSILCNCNSPSIYLNKESEELIIFNYCDKEKSFKDIIQIPNQKGFQITTSFPGRGYYEKKIMLIPENNAWFVKKIGYKTMSDMSPNAVKYIC